tara:strand:+ start:1041 stop:2372 length:1332 start_codon:yes stop_codon:yes gene_type:complete
MDVFKEVEDLCDANHYVDVKDKVPIFLCSIGTHIFNGLNKCGFCPHIPSDHPDRVNDWAIDNCILRHDKPPIYTPMSHVADTRLHIMMRGVKGSGKSILIQMFLAPRTGLLYHANAEDLGMGFRTDIGPNSITEAGMFGSINDEGDIVGRPLAREMCGGFLGFEEMSTLLDASKKEHSVDIKNQLLTSTDNGRVKKVMRDGWVRYLTRYTVWGGTQPGRMDLESGLDRRFFIIDIEMNDDKGMLYKEAQIKASNMTNAERADNAEMTMKIQKWIIKRTLEFMDNPPTGIQFSDELGEWLMNPRVHSHEADLFRRLAIGYTVMREGYEGGKPLMIEMTPYLRNLLDRSLDMRRQVMDKDVDLIKNTFWNSEMTRRNLIKEIASMITNRDYQAAKQWVESNLHNKPWFSEYRPESKGRGRKGIKVFIGYRPKEQKQEWGGGDAEY